MYTRALLLRRIYSSHVRLCSLELLSVLLAVLSVSFVCLWRDKCKSLAKCRLSFLSLLASVCKTVMINISRNEILLLFCTTTYACVHSFVYVYTHACVHLYVYVYAYGRAFLCSVFSLNVRQNTVEHGLLTSRLVSVTITDGRSAASSHVSGGCLACEWTRSALCERPCAQSPCTMTVVLSSGHRSTTLS